MQTTVQRRQQIAFLDKFEQLRRVKVRVKNIRTGKLPALEPLQKVPHQRGLASASFAGQHQQSAMSFNSEHEFSKRGFVRLARKQKTRVRRYVKRIFFQPKGAKHVVVDRGCNRSSHRTPEGRVLGQSDCKRPELAGQPQDAASGKKSTTGTSVLRLNSTSY